MKPYNCEIFDENFNYLYSTLIDEDTFTYRYDAISPVKNKLNVPKDFNPSSLLNEPKAPKGWFVRITRDNELYDGVITGFEEGETQNTIEYSQIITLFDQQVVVETQGITNATSISAFMKSILEGNFSSSADPKQNIHGLTVYANSSKSGILPYTNTDDKYVGINVLNDLMLAAYKYYGIRTVVQSKDAYPHRYAQALTVRFTDNAYYVNRPIFETNLPNIIDSSFSTKKQSGREVNKVIIKDLYFGTETAYYLYTDGTYSTNPSVTGKTRVFPVVTKVIIVNVYELAKNIVDAKYSGMLETVRAYSMKSGNLTNAEYNSLNTVCGVLMPMYMNLIGIGTYSFNKLYDAPNLYDLTQTYVEITSTANNVQVSDSDGGDIFTHFGQSNKSIVDGYEYDGQYNFYGHAMFNVVILVEGSYQEQEDPPVTVTVSKNQYDHIPFDVDAANKTINAYKQTAAYEAEIAAEASSQNIQNILEEKANCEFESNNYSHNIEITVKRDDSLVRPLEWDVGQSFRLVRNGTTYDTILTGREIMRDGLVKLTFGTMRIELTKLLNMKGV